MIRISSHNLSKLTVSRFRALATAAKPPDGAKVAAAASSKVENKVPKGPNPIRIEPFINGFPNMKKAVLVTDLPTDITGKAMADRLTNLNVVSLHMQPGCTLHFHSKEEAEKVASQLTAAKKVVQVLFLFYFFMLSFCHNHSFSFITYTTVEARIICGGHRMRCNLRYQCTKVYL